MNLTRIAQFTLLSILFGFLSPQFSLAQTTRDADALAQSGLKRYPVRSGHVVYKLSGSTTGTQELWFDKWGWREAKYSDQVMEVMGMKNESKSLELLDGEAQYKIDLATKTGTLMRNTMVSSMAERRTDGDLTAAGKEMMERMGGKKVGTETILGKTCEVYEMETFKTKTWVWQGIALKTESNMMNVRFVIEATELEFDIDVPEEKVVVPEDVEVRDLSAVTGN